jgi:hypothetical protein
MRATDGAIRITLASRESKLVAQLVVASIGISLAIGAFLLTRRAQGAFSAPLPLLQLLATACAAAVWAIVVRELSCREPLYISLAMVVLLMLAFACSHPGTRVVDWLVWPAAMFATVLGPRLRGGAPSRSPQRTELPNPAHDGEGDSERVLQQLTRVRTANGQDAIRGLLVGEFAEGERHATLYVAFCPPFERLPEVEANVADDIDATVKLTQVLHNGAQLELRLSEPATEDTRVGVELFAIDAESAHVD